MNPLSGGLPPGAIMRRPPAAVVIEPLLSLVAAVAAAAAVVAGLVLAARRLSGGFTGAEPGLVWLTLGGGLVLLGITDALGRSTGVAGGIAARIGLLIAVAAVTLPPRSNDWVSFVALGMAAAVGVLPPPGLRRGRTVIRRPPRPEPGTPRSPVTTPPPAVPDSREPSPVVRPQAGPPASETPPPPGRLQQRLERFESAEGADCIAGHVRLSIPLGGKSTHAHVGFCPAFAATPTVDVSTDYDGVEAVVTAAEVLPWGVRIECRLSEPAEEPLEIPVDLVAKSPR